GSAEGIGEFADEFEGLLRTDAATTGDDLLRAAQLWTRGGFDDGFERVDRGRALAGIGGLEGLRVRGLCFCASLDRAQAHGNDGGTEGRSRGSGVATAVDGVAHHDALGVALETGGADGHSRSAAHGVATGDVTTVEGVGHE